MKYEEILQEFINKFPDVEYVDYRPAYGLYIDGIDDCTQIPNAIVLWLRDGSKVIYISNKMNIPILEKAKNVIRQNYKDAECGIFHTRNTLGDPMETIYNDDELQIDICRHFEYFEVFGLEKEEFKELAKYYYSLGNVEVEE